jgi:hypothetical protein
MAPTKGFLQVCLCLGVSHKEWAEIRFQYRLPIEGEV